MSTPRHELKESFDGILGRTQGELKKEEVTACKTLSQFALPEIIAKCDMEGLRVLKKARETAQSKFDLDFKEGEALIKILYNAGHDSAAFMKLLLPASNTARQYFTKRYHVAFDKSSLLFNATNEAREHFAERYDLADQGFLLERPKGESRDDMYKLLDSLVYIDIALSRHEDHASHWFALTHIEDGVFFKHYIPLLLRVVEGLNFQGAIEHLDSIAHEVPPASSHKIRDFFTDETCDAIKKFTNPEVREILFKATFLLALDVSDIQILFRVIDFYFEAQNKECKYDGQTVKNFVVDQLRSLENMDSTKNLLKEWKCPDLVGTPQEQAAQLELKNTQSLAFILAHYELLTGEVEKRLSALVKNENQNEMLLFLLKAGIPLKETLSFMQLNNLLIEANNVGAFEIISSPTIRQQILQTFDKPDAKEEKKAEEKTMSSVHTFLLNLYEHDKQALKMLIEESKNPIQHSQLEKKYASALKANDLRTVDVLKSLILPDSLCFQSLRTTFNLQNFSLFEYFSRKWRRVLLDPANNLQRSELLIDILYYFKDLKSSSRYFDAISLSHPDFMRLDLSGFIKALKENKLLRFLEEFKNQIKDKESQDVTLALILDAKSETVRFWATDFLVQYLIDYQDQEERVKAVLFYRTICWARGKSQLSKADFEAQRAYLLKHQVDSFSDLIDQLPGIAKDVKTVSELILSVCGDVELELKLKQKMMSPDQAKRVPLHYLVEAAASSDLCSAALNVLLNHMMPLNTDVVSHRLFNVPDEKGITPLHIAAKQLDFSILNLFRQHKRDLVFPIDSAYTPLDAAYEAKAVTEEERVRFVKAFADCSSSAKNFFVKEYGDEDFLTSFIVLRGMSKCDDFAVQSLDSLFDCKAVSLKNYVKFLNQIDFTKMKSDVLEIKNLLGSKEVKPILASKIPVEWKNKFIVAKKLSLGSFQMKAIAMKYFADFVVAGKNKIFENNVDVLENIFGIVPAKEDFVKLTDREKSYYLCHLALALSRIYTAEMSTKTLFTIHPLTQKIKKITMEIQEDSFSQVMSELRQASLLGGKMMQAMQPYLDQPAVEVKMEQKR